MTNINNLLYPKIIERLPEIISTFIEFYGEEYRDLINERIKSLKLIIYNDPEKVNSFIRDNNLFNDASAKDIYDKNIKRIEGYKNVNKDLELALDFYGITTFKDEVINNEIAFNFGVVENNLVGMLPSIYKDHLVCGLYFPTFGVNYDTLDCTLIHEILHVLEEHIIEKNKDIIKLRGGFETWTIEGKEEPNERKYEFINELIHQKIAIEITRNLHNKGIFIFNNMEQSKQAFEEYEADSCLPLDEFYRNFRNIIIPLKLTGDIEKLKEEIGLEHFDSFANWCYKFYMKFYTPEIRKALNINPSKEYKKYLEKGMSIVQDMLSYSKNKAHTL